MTARGERRRRAILDATLALVGREGTAAVTHRAVAAEAGVPLAATTYYFSSKEDLMQGAMETLIARESANLKAIGDLVVGSGAIEEWNATNAAGRARARSTRPIGRC